MAESWRLFVAVPLSDKIRDLAVATQKRLRRADLFHGPYVRPETMHLTLRFLGDVEQSRVAHLTARLETLSWRPFSIRVDGLGTFGKRRARVVWLGLAGAELLDLQAQVAAVLSDYGSDERAFHPHLTLARVKNAPPVASWREKFASLAPEAATMTIDCVRLMRSVLQPDGTAHIRVAEIHAET